MTMIFNIIIGFILCNMVYSIIMNICDCVITCFKIKYSSNYCGYSKRNDVEDLYPKE